MSPVMNLLHKIIGPLNLVGPIFGKELRTASRQRRNYLLRSFYVLILAVFVAMVWYAGTASYRYDTGSVYMLSRMSRVGVELLMTIGIFQFIALQIISPVLTCTAISDEINRSTLGVLMMTPITSLQIVMGKLLSKMLTVILLICASLPLLVVIRIFGGIDGYRVVEFIGLTLCASLFAASISLAFSIFHKKAYASIIMTYVTLLTIYLLIPLLLAYMSGNFQRSPDTFMYLNPFMGLIWIVHRIESPGGVSGVPDIGHPAIQCALLLGATFLVVLFSSVFVRQVALRMMAGEEVIQVKRKNKKQDGLSSERADESNASILYKQKKTKPVSDRPVLWRELHIPLMGSRRKQFILFAFTTIVLAWTYHQCWGMIDSFETHTTYTTIYMLLAFITAAIVSATTITSEKEASTWQSLLTTPLSSREIIHGKIIGVAGRLLVLVLLYFGHLYFFVASGEINSLALILLTPVFLGPLIFLIGTGTLISTRVKYTTTAVILNIGVGIFTWIILPFILLIMGEWMHKSDNIMEASMAAHPVYLNIECMDNVIENGRADAAWPSLSFRNIIKGQSLDYLSTMIHFAMIGGMYTLTGIFCIEWSIRRLKRRER